MNWTRSLVASAAVVACALVGVAAVAAPAPGPHPASLNGSPADYTVTKAAAGAGMTVTVTVGSAFHVNTAYPVKWNTVPVATTSVAYSGGTTALPSTVTVTTPTNTGTLKIGYCASDGSNCNFAEIAIAP